MGSLRSPKRGTRDVPGEGPVVDLISPESDLAPPPKFGTQKVLNKNMAR